MIIYTSNQVLVLKKFHSYGYKRQIFILWRNSVGEIAVNMNQNGCTNSQKIMPLAVWWATTMQRMSLPVIMDMRERKKERGVKINGAHSGNSMMNSL